MTYRPAPDLLARARHVADLQKISMQALLDTAVAQYVDRAEVDRAAMFEALAGQSREALDILAER